MIKGISPFRAGTFLFICLLVAVSGAFAQFSYLRIATTGLPKGTVGAAYSAQLTATGGRTPYSWALTSGTLPAGLSLKGSTGAIMGTPTTAATAIPLTFRVTDSSRFPQRKSVSLTVTIAATVPPLVISTTPLPNGQVGVPYSTQLAATGGKTPYSWSLTAGTLPAGLTLSTSGALTGTPSTTANATPLQFTLKDSSSPVQMKSANLILTIAAAVPPLAINTTSLPNGQIGSSYSAQLAATGGTAPYSWSLSNGALPAGVTLSSSGQLWGTPTASGSFSPSLQVTDSSSPTQSAQTGFSLQVSAASGGSGGMYGSGINADALNNITVGPHPAVSYRFMANHSGLVQQLHFYLIDTSSNTGYDAGTGGTLSIQLETDDGTSAHNPSSVVLASATIPNPKTNFPAVALSSQPQLYAGSLYHVVFANTDPNPTANYVSVDDLYMYVPQPTMQPAFSDTNWATLIQNQSGWYVYRYNTPVLEVDYTDGLSQGNGYMEVWVGVPEPISGSQAVREQFTVSGNNQNVSSVSIRLARMSGSDDLTVRLEQADGTLIEQGTIPAGNFSLPSGSTREYTWGTYTFSTSHTLSSGHGYHLVLEAPATSTYQAYPIRKGTAYQFQPTTFFPDGYAQFSTDGSTWAGWTQWGVTNRSDSDLQFYFTTIP